MFDNNQLSNKWYVLILSASSCALAVTMPEMCMTVLFKEISDELGLNLVQVGIVWGIVPLGSVAFLLVGGILCDRFGVKRTMTTACFLAGIAGAMRGLSNGFTSLVAFSFFFGLISSIIIIVATKSCRIWFPDTQLGLATSVAVTGGGLGSAIGTIVSATFLSPSLGGWRNVLFLFGSISILLGIIWLFTIREKRDKRKKESETTATVRKAILHVINKKAVWLNGFNYFAYIGSIMAIAGYLPLYLRENGWSAISADGALTVLTLMSIIGAIPLATVSDRLGRRKVVLVPAILTAIICTSLLSVVSGVFIWGIVIVLGVFQRAYEALIQATVLETEGIGIAYSGMALGVVLTLQRIGIFIASPVGNNLASINIGMPFVFWAILLVCGTVILIFTKETGWKINIQ